VTPASPAATGGSAVAWFHCFAGIAGDMALGALIDAGADADEVGRLLDRLGLPGWELRFEASLRGGLSCTRAIVRGEGGVRTYDALVSLVTEAALPQRVTERSLAVFGALARTESALHRRPLDQVHLHEVGGHDAVVDVVGTSAALEVLGVETVSASAVATGTGTVHTSHGWLPNPAPATVRLLEGVPTYGRDVPVELTTPTGAALIAAWCTSFGPLPPMTVTSSGFGGGAAEIDGLPNCTQVVIGRDRTPEQLGSGQPVLLLETNLDDVTGEQLGYAITASLDAGAYDAWVSPVTMKKGRPGSVLHVLADPVHADLLRREIHRATGTLGVRAATVERWPLARQLGEVTVDGLTVRVKVAGDRAKPEFDDVARVAARTGAPLHDVASRAEEAWRAARDRAPEQP
jgi:uncharacterized protein (TIGR00299 family) protein